MIYLELDNVTFQSPKMNPLDRVVKKTQNQIGLFAKLRSLPKIKLGYLRNCENRNFTNCESCENCESQFAKVAKIANIYLKNQTEEKNSPFFGKILTYELITMVDATLSLLSLPEIRKIRQRLR